VYFSDGSNIVVIGGHMTTPTVVLSATPPSIPSGGLVTLTATIPATATGTITFTDGGTLGTLPVSNGVATFTTTNLPGGVNSIQASYSGDNNFFPSISEALTVDVTTVSLTTSSSTVSYGSPVTLTAVVPPQATGTVVFSDSETPIGEAVVVGGTAMFSTAALAAGQHSISAIYLGDSTYSAATSALVTQIVTQGLPSITTLSLPAGIQGWSYTTSLQAVGGTPPYTWSLTSGSLPAGLALASSSGTISGTAAASGSMAFTATVTDMNMKAASAPLSIVIDASGSASQLTDLAPASGLPGTIVTIVGSGFGPVQAEESSLLFGGVAISPLSWSDSAISFQVPSDAQPGNVQVAVSVTSSNISTATFTVASVQGCSAN
jgi:hypothetical protein